MDLSVDEVLNELLTKEAAEMPSDTSKPEQMDFELPPWFDEKLFNKGRRFYWDHCFAFSSSMLMGLVAVFAVPSILRILVGTRRSNSIYTAYRRYLSTLLHTVSWFENELKPGSISWKSLLAVRERHFRASLGAKLQGNGIVSQRDIALTQFGFLGFSLLKPDRFGIRQLRTGDWEAYNHFWGVIGYMIGLEDRYNICRKTVDETRQVCQTLLERVFTPCLENVPEYFEHAARSMLDGMWSVNPSINVNAALYSCRYLADVPGYVYTEAERIGLQMRIKRHLKGQPDDIGVDSTLLISKPAVEGLPDRPPRLLYVRDYDCQEAVPAYRKLTFIERFNLNFNVISMTLYTTYLGKLYFNLHFMWSLILMKYCPYIAFLRFGIKASMVNLFGESPTDDAKSVPNSEYYKPKTTPWYWTWLSFFW